MEGGEAFGELYSKYKILMAKNCIVNLHEPLVFFHSIPIIKTTSNCSIARIYMYIYFKKKNFHLQKNLPPDEVLRYFIIHTTSQTSYRRSIINYSGKFLPKFKDDPGKLLNGEYGIVRLVQYYVCTEPPAPPSSRGYGTTDHK